MRFLLARESHIALAEGLVIHVQVDIQGDRWFAADVITNTPKGGISTFTKFILKNKK